jgi:hypothetical protein
MSSPETKLVRNATDLAVPTPGRARPGNRNLGRMMEKGHPKLGGRRRGSVNKITKNTKDAILTALAEIGDEEGQGGLVGFIKQAVRKDIRHGVHLLAVISPKLVDVDVSVEKTVRYKTLQEIEADFAKRGIKVPEIFRIEYSSDPSDFETIEAEIIPPEPKQDPK